VLEDFNRRVKLDRLRPVVGPFPPMLARTVDVEEVLRQWRALRAERAQVAGKSDLALRPAPTSRTLPTDPALAHYDSEPWWRRLLDLVRGR
jgi:hypothetical protein